MSAIVHNIQKKIDVNVDDLADKVSKHLNRHYYFYKALSASMMITGVLISLYCVGVTWPKMDEIVFEPFFESSIGEKILLIYEIINIPIKYTHI